MDLATPPLADLFNFCDEITFFPHSGDDLPSEYTPARLIGGELHSQAEDLLNPMIMLTITFKWTVNCPETASTLDISIQIRRHPIDGADDIVRFEVDPLDDSEMKDANIGMACTFHSFDGNSIP